MAGMLYSTQSIWGCAEICPQLALISKRLPLSAIPMQQTVPNFLAVLSYQVFAVRNYLRHFKKGVAAEFLPGEKAVVDDWETNAYSLVFLVGPAFALMESSRAGASDELLRQIQLNMSRLKNVHNQLRDAYLSFSRQMERSGFKSARPWLIMDVEHAIFGCTKWLERIANNAEGDLANSLAALDVECLEQWVGFSAPEIPAKLADLERALSEIDRLIPQINADKVSDTAFCSTVLAENSLLQLCMASRRLFVSVFFLLITQRNAVSEGRVAAARDALRVCNTALDGFTESRIAGEKGAAEVALEGIRLLRQRLQILEELAMPKPPFEKISPAVKLLLAEQKTRQSDLELTSAERLLLARDAHQVA